MKYACISDIGLLREKNQDSFLVCKNEYDDLLAIVCDGIGGGLAGEVASLQVVDYFKEVFEGSGPFANLNDVISYLEYHASEANRSVYLSAKKNREYKGMGTTLTGILACKHGVVSLNCGDSRVYGFLDKMIVPLTVDHTLVNQMLEKGEITLEEAENHPKKHYLTKAIGIFEYMDIDVHKVKDMNYYLICSDGLHGLLDEEEMQDIVMDKDLSLEQKVESLKDLALLKGGYDNITAVLVER